MKKHLSAAILALLTLTACNDNTEATQDAEPRIEPLETAENEDSTEETTPAFEASAPGTKEESTVEENISERGSLILEPGDEGFVVDAQGTELITFTVQSIEIDPECTGQWAEDPEHGRFVVFDAWIESDATAGDYYLDPGLFFNQYSYRVIDAAGVTRSEPPATNASFSCFPESEQMPANIGPGEKASGKVVFDVANNVTTLLLSNEMGEDLQWEWNF